jgi:hypothetical protein
VPGRKRAKSFIEELYEVNVSSPVLEDKWLLREGHLV